MGGAEGLDQEDPRQSGSSGHWCQGVPRDFTRKIPDSRDTPDWGCRGKSPGGSQTVRMQKCVGDFPRRIPDSQDPSDIDSAGTFPGGSQTAC